MAKIFITRRIPEVALKLLKEAGHKVKMSTKNRPLTPEEIIKKGNGAGALITLLTDKVDSALLDGIGKQLKVVVNYAVGYDNFDLNALKERGILAGNTAGLPAISESVAEHTIALIMSLSKRIVEGDLFIRKGKYKFWDPGLLIGAQVSGKVLGVIGLGRIGKFVSKFASLGLGMKVLYYDINRDENFEREVKAEFAGIDDILRRSDFVSLHVPLLPSTKYLINAEKLSLMKSSAYLINTARGAVVKEADLYEALEKGTIAGAALDVYECEPELVCDIELHKKVKKLPNLILTPHIASATKEARDAMAELAAKNVIAGLKGEQMVSSIKM